jgi:NTE family protein
METGIRKKIGLALGAGSVRGFAHIGVLSVLIEAGIPIDYVAGSSVGSLIGAAYCSGMSLDEIAHIADEFKWRKIAGPAWSGDGLASFEKMEKFIDTLFDNPTFDDFEIPLSVVATDIDADEAVVISEGRVAPAVRASCSFAGVISPVSWNGRRLADGVFVDSVPVSVVREMGAGYVIGVDVLKAFIRPRGGLISYIINAIEIALRHAGGGTKSADCLISPEIGGFTYLRYSKRGELIERGRQAAVSELPEIQQAIFGNKKQRY